MLLEYSYIRTLKKKKLDALCLTSKKKAKA